MNNHSTKQRSRTVSNVLQSQSRFPHRSYNIAHEIRREQSKKRGVLEHNYFEQKVNEFYREPSPHTPRLARIILIVVFLLVLVAAIGIFLTKP